MKEGLIKDTYEALMRELQAIISISYIIAVGIGMLFNFQKFSEFGINIFDYADVFDFLIAPFSDTKIFLFSVLSITTMYLLLRLDIFWKKRSPRSYSRAIFGLDKKSWYNGFRYFTFALGFILYLYLAADIYGKVSRKEVMAQSPITLRYLDNEIKTGKMIGKTSGVIFLMNNKKVVAIPINSLVKEFEIK